VKTVIASVLLITGQVSGPQITQTKLDKLSDACKAPRAWLRSIGHDEVTFMPPMNARHRTANCVLNQIKRSKLPMKLGFIGNEQYEPVK